MGPTAQRLVSKHQIVAILQGNNDSRLIRVVSDKRFQDKTRVDCLTKDYAIEFDFAKKWAESAGQALYYGKMTGKKPAVVLILEAPSDLKYVKRVEKISSDIQIFLVKAF